MRTRNRLALAAFPCLLALMGCKSASAPAQSEATAKPAEAVATAAPVAIPPTADKEEAKPTDTDAPKAPVAAASAAPPPPAMRPRPSTASAPAESVRRRCRPRRPRRRWMGRRRRSPAPAPTTIAPSPKAGRAGDWADDDRASAALAAPPANFSGVKAGEWDDNANYREFQKYLGAEQVAFHPVDVRDRRFLVVRDARRQGRSRAARCA